MSDLALQLSHAAVATLETSSDSGAPLVLLLLGPAGAAGVYWVLYRYYRNTDKSHDFEKETIIESQPATGSDHKVDTVSGTKRTQINGNNVTQYRKRVQRSG
ncbi:hypothetical protein C6I20_07610 [Aeromicrobium sp. A1-2]|uniref:hypothetical protein n=1 Tax=Aeromicrobium sp. A1-2 TaxID=2107713 RepID=UPI000E46CE04|nr:hypothetical protein [Aeromicrobium sp. A1-2]AXT85065.1 hypothetical protein C6I20_07610 [Aeromicrobium sp. A1-2]